jgi:O-antigen/teichoic acid export membrane protein
MKLPDAAQFRDRLLPITLSQGIGFLCGLIGVKISTKLISPADYGAFGVFMTFTPLGMWVVHAGLIKFTARHWAASPDRGALFREVLRAGTRKLPWLIVATLAAALAMDASGFLRLWPALFVSASLLSVGLLAQTALQAERSHWKDFVVSTAASLSRSFLPPLLYYFAGASLFALEAGFCLHTAIFAGGCLYLLSKYRVLAPTPLPQLKAVYEGPLFILLSLAAWLMTGVNRWIVAAFFGTEKAGYFTLAGNLTLIATGMLSIIFVQYFQPGIFASASEEPELRHKLARRIDLIAAAFCVLAMSGVVVLRWIAPWLVGPLISENYRTALDTIIPAGFFSVAVLTEQFYHTMLLAGHREKACGAVDLATAIMLGGGGLIVALAGERWFLIWLTLTPVVPWILSRPLARHYFFKPVAVGEHAPAP